METDKLEHKTILISVLGALFMALLGIGFGIFTNSEAILLDGLFSLTSFVIASITLRISSLINIKATKDYHFGLASLEPMINLTKGMVMLVLCSFAAIDATQVILRGGHKLDGLYALVYACIAGSGCFLVFAIVNKNAKRSASPILQADATNWLIDAIISAAVGVAFLFAYILKDTSINAFIPFLDSSLVVIIVIAVSPLPVKLIITNFHQGMLGAPPQSSQKNIIESIEHILNDSGHIASKYRMVQLGRHTFTTVDLTVSHSKPVGELDSYRNKINTWTRINQPNLTVDLIFHGSEKSP